MVTKHLLSKCFLTIHMRFRVCLIQLLLLAGPIPVSEKEWLHYYLWWDTISSIGSECNMTIDHTWTRKSNRHEVSLLSRLHRTSYRHSFCIHFTSARSWTWNTFPSYVRFRAFISWFGRQDIWTRNSILEPYSYNYIVGFYI